LRHDAIICSKSDVLVGSKDQDEGSNTRMEKLHEKGTFN
jgi:hypothetical protein